MRNLLLVFLTFLCLSLNAQTTKQESTISVNGSGKIMVTPDYATIQIGVITKGNSYVEVKKENDIKIDAVIKYLNKMNISKEDFQTKNVSLNRLHDYEKKKDYYQAEQIISLKINDLSKYDVLMQGLTAQGVNNIQNIEFKSTQIKKYESEARKKAMQNAKEIAEDYLSETNQKIIKVLTINDNSVPISYFNNGFMAMAKSYDAAESVNETLAIGEISVTANVQVVYLLN